MLTTPETEKLLPPQNEVVVPFEDGRFLIRCDDEAFRRRVTSGFFSEYAEFSEWMRSIQDEISLRMIPKEEHMPYPNSVMNNMLEKIHFKKDRWLAYANGLPITLFPDAIIAEGSSIVSTLPAQESRVAFVKQILDSVLRHESQHVRQEMVDFWNDTNRIGEATSKHDFRKWGNIDLLTGIGTKVGATALYVAPFIAPSNIEMSVAMVGLSVPLIGASMLFNRINMKEVSAKYANSDLEIEAQEKQKPEYFVNSPLDVQFLKD